MSAEAGRFVIDCDGLPVGVVSASSETRAIQAATEMLGVSARGLRARPAEPGDLRRLLRRERDLREL